VTGNLILQTRAKISGKESLAKTWKRMINRHPEQAWSEMFSTVLNPGKKRTVADANKWGGGGGHPRVRVAVKNAPDFEVIHKRN
jgi:hypothetical protein